MKIYPIGKTTNFIEILLQHSSYICLAIFNFDFRLQTCNQLPKKSRDTKLYQEIYGKSNFLSSFILVGVDIWNDRM